MTALTDINMEWVACPFCDADDPALVECRPSSPRGGFRAGMPLVNVICKRCTLVYLTPRVRRKATTAYYESMTHLEVPNTLSKAEKRFLERHGEVVARFCLAHGFSGKSVLEVGCGYGYNLEAFKQRGFDVLGIEPSTERANVARSLGIPVITTPLENYTTEGGGGVDLIVLSHVLEHLPDAIGALRKVRELLAPNGMLYIEVPNLYRHDSFRPSHLYTFDETTLKATLGVAGFSVQSLETHGKGQVVPWFGWVLSALCIATEPKPIHLPLADYRIVLRKRIRGRIIGRVGEAMNPISVRSLVLRVFQAIVGKSLYGLFRRAYRMVLRHPV